MLTQWGEWAPLLFSSLSASKRCRSVGKIRRIWKSWSYNILKPTHEPRCKDFKGFEKYFTVDDEAAMNIIASTCRNLSRRAVYDILLLLSRTSFNQLRCCVLYLPELQLPFICLLKKHVSFVSIALSHLGEQLTLHYRAPPWKLWEAPVSCEVLAAQWFCRDLDEHEEFRAGVKPISVSLFRGLDLAILLRRNPKSTLVRLCCK